MEKQREDNKQLENRKSDHIRINLNEDIKSGVNTGLDNYHFIHEALPEVNLDDINLRINIFHKLLESPLLISSMVGGTELAGEINRNLAIAAHETKISMGLGSMRIAVEDINKIDSFQVRKFAPNILLFANLGAIQLNYQFTVDTCKKMVDIIEADALILHLNPLQEALQPEGNTKFSGLLNKIENICKNLKVPVVIKEVGWGISEKTARRLIESGVAAIDVAGAGGTSWSQVEMYRAENGSQARIAAGFRDWGISTADSICQIRQEFNNKLIIASGGLRNGIDVAKCIALGASLCGMAGPFLKTATNSIEDTILLINETSKQLQIAMFASGASDIYKLQNTPLVLNSYR